MNVFDFPLQSVNIHSYDYFNLRLRLKFFINRMANLQFLEQQIYYSIIRFIYIQLSSYLADSFLANWLFSFCLSFLSARVLFSDLSVFTQRPRAFFYVHNAACKYNNNYKESDSLNTDLSGRVNQVFANSMAIVRFESSFLHLKVLTEALLIASSWQNK